MLVIDASALTELIVGGPRASAIGPVMEDDGDWRAPEHFMVEVVSALRGMWLGGHLSKEGSRLRCTRRLEPTCRRTEYRV
ncbi:hypothetical protein MLP_43740 [Microlunatus phosphovorus NM-1]|uniref:PIN domain-containing protein n=1 Tax=Microlunatus phosphovorus (strain ATCC 700054 / DSM 10555 / JCM 9379 / NBRC 101784 / NCIMB 13414 / VKM Ac-1990 / NM-1) TaxID=1032480 RepID=F5XSY0_MICPN|nr:hypothetical protein [Microlunatus phosphovorus]BAK37388.1 hypothetical protein MLP_43740 [Microlunatus phosphovorus NM-1]